MKPTIWITSFLIFILVACTNDSGQLKPGGERGEVDAVLSDQPQLVTFSELQADPDAYRDRLIRVTGVFYRMPPPACFPYSGPKTLWSLISEDLRLDAVGFEPLTRLISEEIEMTVDGFFRLYEGPIGCGKGAPKESAWYLDVIKIVQPNPLVKSLRLFVDSGTLSAPPPFPTPAESSTGQPAQPPAETTDQATPVPTATPIGTVAVLPTPITTLTAPISTIPATGVPTATPTTQTTTRFPGTPTPSPTATSSSIAPNNTPTSGPFPTVPPLPTATEGYPTFPTPTSDIYPGPPANPTGYPGR